MELSLPVFTTQVCRDRGFSFDLQHAKQTLYIYATAVLGNLDHEGCCIPMLKDMVKFLSGLSTHTGVLIHIAPEKMHLDISHLLFSTKVFMKCFDVLSFIMLE